MTEEQWTADDAQCEVIKENMRAHERSNMSQLFYVDIPTEECINDDDGAFKNIGVFTTKEEAIKFAQEHFGADKNGCICLVTG